MGLVKTRRLAAMHKQQKAKAGMKPPMPSIRNVNGFTGIPKSVRMSRIKEVHEHDRRNAYGTR